MRRAALCITKIYTSPGAETNFIRLGAPVCQPPQTPLFGNDEAFDRVRTHTQKYGPSISERGDVGCGSGDKGIWGIFEREMEPQAASPRPRDDGNIFEMGSRAPNGLKCL